MIAPAQCYNWHALPIKKSAEATLRAFLGSFGFSGERMDTPCESFSGGERARLALAFNCLATS